MQHSLTRQLAAVFFPMVFFTVPLSLVGCGEDGGGSSGEPAVNLKKIEEAHKDSMAEFKKNMETKTAKKK